MKEISEEDSFIYLHLFNTLSRLGVDHKLAITKSVQYLATSMDSLGFTHVNETFDDIKEVYYINKY